jgi:hypothetical protein
MDDSNDEGEDGVADDGDDNVDEYLDDEYDVNMSRSAHDQLALSQEMIDAIRDARFEDDMNNAILSQMMDPPRSQPDINYSKQISIRVFDELRNGSQQMYNGIRRIMADLCPPILLDSYHVVKTSVKDITGVEHIETNMCPKSCIAYTGPFSTLEECPYCAEL